MSINFIFLLIFFFIIEIICNDCSCLNWVRNISSNKLFVTWLCPQMISSCSRHFCASLAQGFDFILGSVILGNKFWVLCSQLIVYILPDNELWVVIQLVWQLYGLLYSLYDNCMGCHTGCMAGHTTCMSVYTAAIQAVWQPIQLVLPPI